MCGRVSAIFLFSWPNSRASVMGGEQAASVLATVKAENFAAEGKPWTPDDEATLSAPMRTRRHPYFATAPRLWDDGIIAPSETRRVVALALAPL